MNAPKWVEENFGPRGYHRPDIVGAYLTLSDSIIKADILRYLVMFAEGGVYADIDVEALKPVSHFIPNRFDVRDVDMIIGIETDQPEFKDHPILGSKSQSFVQWSMVCKPGLPVMLKLVDQTLECIYAIARDEKVSLAEVQLDFDQVLSCSGPSAFTKAILTYMSKTSGEEITWDNFHNMAESRLLDGILILPSEAFAAGTGHSDSGNHGSSRALIKHHFHASSWPTKHPRYKHPMYGPVEACNWVPQCVKLWDTNVAFFDALPEPERLKLIAAKELEDAKREEFLRLLGEKEAQEAGNMLGNPAQPIAVPAPFGGAAENILPQDPAHALPFEANPGAGVIQGPPLAGQPAVENDAALPLQDGDSRDLAAEFPGLKQDENPNAEHKP